MKDIITPGQGLSTLPGASLRRKKEEIGLISSIGKKPVIVSEKNRKSPILVRLDATEMAPNYPPHGNGSEKRNESEDTEPPSETESLLAPAISNQMLPSTPTLGTSLAAPWRHHQGSAPSSPHLSGARSLTVSPVVSRKNYMRKEYEKRSRPSSSGGRKAIR